MGLYTFLTSFHQILGIHSYSRKDASRIWNEGWRKRTYCYTWPLKLHHTTLPFPFKIVVHLPRRGVAALRPVRPPPGTAFSKSKAHRSRRFPLAASSCSSAAIFSSWRVRCACARLCCSSSANTIFSSRWICCCLFSRVVKSSWISPALSAICLFTC